MPEQSQMVRLRKAAGGNTVQWEGTTYAWGKDGSAEEVPYGLARSLLAIPDGGYSVDGDETVPAGNPSVSGTVQSAETAGLGASAEGATAPGPAEPSGEEEEKPAPPPGSPVTPRPRGGTRSTAPSK